MATNEHKKQNGPRFIDMLSEESLQALKGFGHIYKDPNTGRNHIRAYKSPRPLKLKKQHGSH